MSNTVDVYWSFRSPYSYIATPDMLRLIDDFDIVLNLRTVLPIAVRSPEFFSPENAKRAIYIMRDWPRRAEFLGMRHAWPSPDPVVQDLETLKIAEEQPYIFRLSKLGIEAQRRGHGAAFVFEVSHLLFGGTPDWHLGDHLSKAAERAGLDLGAMDEAIMDGDHLEEIEANQHALDASGHWGVPTFVFNDEPFFGQDRVDVLRWRLAQHGLEKPSGTGSAA